MSIVEVLGIGHHFPGKCCCLICTLTENGCTLIEKRYRASCSCHYRIRDCRCNVTARRAIANLVQCRRAGRPCGHCVGHCNTVCFRCRVHRHSLSSCLLILLLSSPSPRCPLLSSLSTCPIVVVVYAVLPCRSSLSSCQCCPLQLSLCLSSEGSVNALK